MNTAFTAAGVVVAWVLIAFASSNVGKVYKNYTAPIEVVQQQEND